MQYPELPDGDRFYWPMAASTASLQDRAYKHIVYLLLCGYFRPGESISLRQLASGLHVSETPVRAALSKLTAESALDILPNRHFCVPSLTQEQFQELTELRVLLETEIARHAYRRTRPSDIRQLKEVNDALNEAAQRRQLHRAIELNQKFHFQFYSIAERHLSLALISQLWLRTGALMFTALQSDESHWRSSHHDELLDALTYKDIERATAAIRDDVTETYKMTCKLNIPHLFRVPE